MFRPRADATLDFGEAEASSFGGETSPEPRFPKSLYLVRPLFSSYDLNPVAASAQESVPIPEGLDLVSWIVPPPKEEAPVSIQDEEAPGGHKAKKSKKGKAKDLGAKTKGKKRREDHGSAVDTLITPSTETEEDRAERERVSLRIEILSLHALIDSSAAQGREIGTVTGRPLLPNG